MPGQLKPSARCPWCHTPLLAIFDTSTKQSVTREYFHQKGYDGRDQISPKARRKRRCVAVFVDHDKAARERRRLEVRNRRGKHGK